MAEPLQYQAPLPDGRNLRIQELEDGVRISRDAISTFALWREVAIFGAALLVLPALALYSFWWAWHYWNVASTPQVLLRIGIGIFILAAMVRTVPDAIQNAGIITEIAVTKDALYWRKQNLWGSRETFWPLSTIREVKIDPINRILKIHRFHGTPLGAFSFHPMPEMTAAAEVLNHVIARNRSPQTISPSLPPLDKGPT